MNTLGKKVMLASISLLLLLLGCSILVVRELKEGDDLATYVMRDYRRALLDGEFHEALTRATGEAASYVLTGNTVYRNESIEALERAGRVILSLREVAANGPAKERESFHLSALEGQDAIYRALQAEILQAKPARPDASQNRKIAGLDAIYAREDELEALAKKAIAHHEHERSENEEDLHRHSSRVRALVLASLAGFAVWMVLVIVYVRWRVVAPLNQLAGLTQSIAAGDLSRSAPITNRDEVGQLQAGYNQMLSQLTEQRRELAALIEGLSRSRDEAETANRAKSEFLAKVSHEIRTPMNGVMVSLDLLHETATDTEQRELADLARSSARSLLLMLNDLLDFSRIEAGKMSLDSSLFDPRQLVTHLVELHGRRAHLKGLAMHCTIAEGLPAQLCGDPLRLSQILLNLIDNAIKYTEQGEITVTLSFEEASPALTEKGDPALWLRFEVSDTGAGVPSAAADKIFDPFFQAEHASNQQYAGVGLGLGIARQLARMMGGELDFSSSADQGSVFWFSARLQPASACVRKAAAAGPEQDEMPDPENDLHRQFPPGNRVLLAEDNRANREVMARMLGRRGLEVQSVGNGRDALALATAERFDIVLMDCRMPEMDGFETVRAIRALDGERARVTVVALTAYAIVAEKQRYLEAGFDDLLGKPFTYEQIESVLHRWLVLERQEGRLRTHPETGRAAAI